MRITCLVENTSCFDDIGAEHGLSLYIETNSHKILFDMGQTELFAVNAGRLGVNVSDVDIAVLSHGHYDHGGGLAEFLRLNKKAMVYMSLYAFEPHYNGDCKYIGLAPELEGTERFVYTENVLTVGNGLTLYSCNDRERIHGSGTSGMTAVQNGETVPDDFRHEQYLMIEEVGKTVLISGCSHKGILNITEWFSPDVLVGGFHFSKLPTDEVLARYAEILNSTGTKFYTCHCTGKEQYEYMHSRMNRLFYLSAGQTIEI